MDVEGVYKWVVLLPSKTHTTSSEVGVPNRYYGKFEDGKLKVRGIEVQRHSTPGWVFDAQQAMLEVFSRADTAAQFRALIPEALGKAKEAAARLRARQVDPDALGLMVQSTRAVEEYRANTATRNALKRLEGAGTKRRAGEYVKYVVARRQGPNGGRATPVELFGKRGLWEGEPGQEVYHVESYLRLLARSVETLLAPFGYAEDPVLEWLAGRAPSPLPGRARLPDPGARPAFVRSPMVRLVRRA
jgi:DNA polymerase-2